MMISRLRLARLLVFVLVTAGCASDPIRPSARNGAAPRLLRVGDRAPETVGRDLDGRPITLGDYRGKTVLLNFWATWCGICVANFPAERELVERYRGRPFALVGVNSDGDLQTARDTVARHHLNWRSFWDGPDGRDGPIARLWVIEGWPTTYLIDPKGMIRGIDLGPTELEFELEKLFPKKD
jgi:peroxiredoxin